MFNHQYNFDIEIPKEVITQDKHDHIFEQHLKNKVILGLCGYGKSGKDTIAKIFVDKYHFHRVAFADNLKVEMNKFLKEPIFNYLNQSPERRFSHVDGYHPDVIQGLSLEDGRTLTMDMIDFQTEDIAVKKRLRPFIIWYGEKIREINGAYYWINKAFEINAAGEERIILSDVRRLKELEIFEGSNSQKKRLEDTFANAGCLDKTPKLETKSYSTTMPRIEKRSAS